MKNKITLFVVIFTALFLLISCGNEKKDDCQLIFETNGGTEIAPHTFSGTYNLDDLSLFITTKDNHTFISWHLDTSLSNDSLAKGNITKTTTLYAKWEEVEEEYMLVFITNGGTEIAPHTFSGTYNLDDLSLFITTKDNHTFISWHLDASLSDGSLAKGNITKTTTLYAKWEEVKEAVYYTITFMQGDVVLETVKTLENTIPVYTGNVPTMPDTDQHYFEFSGWGKEILKATDDETYNAVFVVHLREFLVKYHDEDGNVIHSEVVTYGHDALGHNALVKEGHTFSKWSLSISNITKDTLLYPIYTVNTYLITFNNDDGSLLYEQNFAYGTLPEYGGHTPTKESTSNFNYIFIGWNKELIIVKETTIYQAIYEEVIKELNEINKEEFNEVFNADIYKLFPAIKSDDYLIESVVEGSFAGIYVYLNDWEEDTYLEYLDNLHNLFSYDEVSGNFTIESETLNQISVLYYPQDDSYVLFVFASDWFHKNDINLIMGFDVYSLLPNLEITKYLVDDESNDTSLSLYLTIYNWTELDATNYIDLLDGMLSYDQIEDAYVLEDAFIYVGYEEVGTETYFGIAIYKYLKTEEPEDDLYFTFNMQDVLDIGSGNYASNVNKELEFSDAIGYLEVYGTQLMNVTGSSAAGLTTGITFAANTKSGGNEAILEFNTLSNDISSLEFSFLAETNFSSQIVSAKLEVFNGSAWVTHTDFYYELKNTLTTIFIENINSSTFRLVFTGSGASSNNGRFMIHEVSLYNNQTPKTFEEVLTYLDSSFKDPDFSSYLVTVTEAEDFSVTSIGINEYLIKGSFLGSESSLWIDDFYDRLLLNGWTVSDFNYVYNLENSSYVISVAITGNEINFNISLVYNEGYYQTADKKDYFSSMNDYQLTYYDKSGLPSTGNVNVLVVPIEIKEVSFPAGYLEDLDTVFNGTTEETGFHSVKSYYNVSSYERLNLNFTISPKYTTTYNQAYYQGYSEAGDQIIILEALNYLDPLVDFSDYDANNDSVIDSVIFIYSVTYDDNDPWWAWVYVPEEDLETNAPVLDGMTFSFYMWASYDFMFDDLGDDVIYNAETYIHEMGHLFGLSDYYAMDKDYGLLGGFDMMDANVGDHGPFNKLVLGWIEPLYAYEGEYLISLDKYSLYEEGLDQVLVIPKNDASFDDVYGYSEFIIMMFYQPEGLYSTHLGFPGTLNEGGIIIYHVNANVANNADYWEHFKYENYDATNQSLIRILEADKNGSLKKDNPITTSDILRSGTLDLSTYMWFDGSKINVSISLSEQVTKSLSKVDMVVYIN